MINYFNDYKSIKKIAKLYLNIFDGLGTQRVVNHILRNDRTKFKIKNFKNAKNKVLIIAEIGINHLGNEKYCKKAYLSS